MDDALHLRCQDLVEQLTDYLDDALPPERMRLVREHLALCDGCSAHLEQLRKAVAAIEATPAERRRRSTSDGWRPCSGSGPRADERRISSPPCGPGTSGPSGALVAEHESLLLRLARVHTPSDAVAEEVVQETWLAVLNGLDGVRGPRVAAHLDLADPAQRGAPPGRPRGAVAAVLVGGRARRGPDWFMDSGPWEGHWRAFPSDWSGQPEERMLGKEVRSVVDRELRALPAAQREVVTLRDVEGWPADEVCELLDISAANQRVLLHRGRNRVRAALERYFEDSL